MSVDTMMSASFYGVPRAGSVYTDIISDGLLVRWNTASLGPSGDPNITRLDTASISVASTGIKVTHTFKMRLPQAWSFLGQVRVACRWTVVAAGQAGSLGRMNMTVQKSGSAIDGLTKFNGTSRALDAAPGTAYDERWQVVAIPSGTSWTAGSSIDILLELEVTTSAAGGTTLTHGLHCDPSSTGDEIVVEFDTGAD